LIGWEQLGLVEARTEEWNGMEVEVEVEKWNWKWKNGIATLEIPN
jgi:hypothetical protein